MNYHPHSKRDAIKNYLPLPNKIFCMGLCAGEIAVYAYLYARYSFRNGDFMQDKKKKYTYWMRPSTVKETESMLSEANATTKKVWRSCRTDLITVRLTKKQKN